MQRSSNMSSSAEYGRQIVAVVTKLIVGVRIFCSKSKSFVHSTVEARSESVGPRATARHSKNAPTKAEKDFEMTKHAKLLHDELSIVRFARKQIEGKITGLETRDFYDAIVKCADARRAPGESDAQAFTKTIIEDETGRLLFKALQLAPSSTTTAQPTEWAVQRITEWVANGQHTHSHGYNVSGWTILPL